MYRFGESAETLAFSSGEVVLSIAAINTTNNQFGEIVVNGGDVIRIAGGDSFNWNLSRGSLINPTISFSSNLKWFVDWVI